MADRENADAAALVDECMQAARDNRSKVVQSQLRAAVLARMAPKVGGGT